jgi:Tol biopolymer transport system component
MSSADRSESWSELSSLVDKLLDAPPDERRALIDELSGGDPVRRAELEALVVECEREPTLLGAPAAERFTALLSDDPTYPPSLAERYPPARELGRGGMATVYLARDVKHGRDVAVKVVHSMVAAALGVDRFLREIEIVARLRHPHIVPLYDSGEADGALYYVMPYERGLSLRERLARSGPLSIVEATIILRDVCDALAHAHAHGVVHRDIKPGNVLLSGRHATVTDFGVAKAMVTGGSNDATATGISLGTPTYMAPEQIAADPQIDHRADIYAVGVLAYEIFTGHPPFVHADRQGVLRAHLTETPRPITELRPDIPAPLAELVMKCLEKRPDDRWQTADEMVERIARGGSVVIVPARTRRLGTALTIVDLFALVAFGFLVWGRTRGEATWRDRWSSARIERISDFEGSEVDAAISSDGQFVSFLSDRDSVFDALVGRVGTGEFVNLTGGRFPQLFNEDVRNVGFTPDAAHVWIRVADLTAPASVSLVPTMGGTPRRFLDTAVMVAWSPDGTRLAYHETTAGDPIFIAGGDGSNPTRIHIGPPGSHSHHLSWSPDGRYIYFAHGLPPNDMDVWRVPVAGGRAEQVTSHNSRVAYPVMVDDHTLFYTATDDDGTGPWLYMMDVDERVPTRLSSGVEQFVSIAISAEVPGRPRRLVATVSNPRVRLSRVPVTPGVAGEESVTSVSLPTARAAAPRFAPDSSVIYLASRGGADGLWRLAAGRADELWKPTNGAVVGAAAVSPDGATICFPVRQAQRASLRCTTADGTGMRVLFDSLDVRGAPSWSPDGRWLAFAARDGDVIRVFKIPAAGGAASRLVDSVSSNPVWSPDGTFILYSGTARGRVVPVKAVRPDGTPHPLPFSELLVDRLGDSYRFLPDGKHLVVKLGGFRRQDFWLIDLPTGVRRQLTRLSPGESLQRFDVSLDGKHVLFERVQENSDIALIELPSR